PPLQLTTDNRVADPNGRTVNLLRHGHECIVWDQVLVAPVVLGVDVLGQYGLVHPLERLGLSLGMSVGGTSSPHDILLADLHTINRVEQSTLVLVPDSEDGRIHNESARHVSTELDRT